MGLWCAKAATGSEHFASALWSNSSWLVGNGGNGKICGALPPALIATEHWEKKGSKCTAKSKENPPIKANTFTPANLHILVLTHLSIFRGGKNKDGLYIYRATLCINNKRRCLDFCSSFRVEHGEACFRLIASSLIYFFFAPSIPSATCLNSSLGYSFTFC